MDLARKRYESGERDYVNGRFWQAAKAFEEAFDLSKRPDLLFNAARAYDRGEYGVRAIEGYQAYLDAVPEAPDKVLIQKRVVELQGTLAKLMIVTNEQGFLFIDGHEYGRTPMQQPMDIDSGYHRVEVRKDNRSWAKESQFSAGQSYKFDAELGSAAPGGQGLADTTAGEERRPKQRVRRLAVSAGIGAAVLISFISLLGIIIIPFQRGTFRTRFLSPMLSFAVGALLAGVGLTLPEAGTPSSPADGVKLWSWFNSQARLKLGGRQHRVEVSITGDDWKLSRVDVLLNDPLTPEQQLRVRLPQSGAAP